jgi:sodium/proline symporter
MDIHIITFIIYFIILLIIGLISARKSKTDKDYILGDRSLNFWLTALSAHASDMSSWLFLAYPALIFTGGLFNVWAAIGLTFFMFLNWQFVAPKLRTLTEKSNSLTVSAFFESVVKDKSNAIRIVSALSALIFYTVYISSGLIGLGLLVDSLFHIPYWIGITIGISIVVAYVYAGGYKTVAWIDLFQGFFLLGVIIAVPVFLLKEIGGFGPIFTVGDPTHVMSLLPNTKPSTLFAIISLSAGWGLGYFGQPHIITKFMGAKDLHEVRKSKYLGMSWQITALTGATLIGLLGIYFFPNGLNNAELVILKMVEKTLTPFFSGIILCAILAATTNVVAAQVLVTASSLSEDFYKRLIHKTASSKELLWVSRLSVILISAIALGIALFKVSSIYALVLYAWSGLGASFGPMVLFSLYSKSINKYGALSSIIVGALIGAFWPLINRFLQLETAPLFPSLF